MRGNFERDEPDDRPKESLTSVGGRISSDISLTQAVGRLKEVSCGGSNGIIQILAADSAADLMLDGSGA